MQQYFSITYIVTATTVRYAICDHDSDMCWALVGIGSVIVAILLIALITCMVFIATIAKGTGFFIQYLSRANGERDTQPQQQQPQNEGNTMILYSTGNI